MLVVDEAHHLSTEVLEEIRLLTNLETAQGKLLQILLVGQPELDEKLDLVELRQLKQRIALRARLEPLKSRGDRWLRSRVGLQMAGATLQRMRAPFSPVIQSPRFIGILGVFLA